MFFLNEVVDSVQTDLWRLHQ